MPMSNLPQEKKSPNIKGFFVRFWFTMRIAFHGLITNPLRTLLTILGVAIGVGSVVSLMGIGEGARLAVVEQFESLGVNVISIEAHDKSVEFKPAYAEELLERVENLEYTSPYIQTQATLKWRRERVDIDIIGTGSRYDKIRDMTVINGHFFSKIHVDKRVPVAVLGYNVSQKMMNGRNPVGRTIVLNGESYRIIGVLGQKGPGKADDIDDKIIIPYTKTMQMDKLKTVGTIVAKSKDAKKADLAVVQLSRIIKKELGLKNDSATGGESENPGEMPVDGGMVLEGTASMDMGSEVVSDEMFNAGDGGASQFASSNKDSLISITNLNTLVKEADNANRVMTLLLGGIASVSLLVGGLGIMNIMLVAVSERTSEIGLRRAIGAKQNDLILQFILEAIYVSMIGALVGVVIGIWGLQMFRNLGYDAVVSFKAIQIASMVSIASGMLFGVYPAVSASSILPAEALRRE